MKITNFLNNNYSDSALYINFRATPSYIDGLKNSGRKCLYTLKKKNQKSEVKVSNFAGSIIDESNYLHGNTSMEGTIVTLSQNYCGSNNVPILEGVGAFGTRFCPEAAASRYIFVKSTNYLDYLFKNEDQPNLITQEFEGVEIEPAFYVPTLPMLLVNGSSGIGVGFAPEILSRSTTNIIKAIKNKLAGKKVSEDLFTPSWRGFTGTVSKVENNKWEIRGVAEINDKKVTITELPISYSLLSYTKKLSKLKEKGTISKYTDYSEDDKFKFEIILPEEEAKQPKDVILKDLGLIDVVTESLVCLDENNAIKEYDSVVDIFKDYYSIKIKYLEKRIKSEIKRLEAEDLALKETVKFIKEVIKGTINLKLKKAEVEKVLKEKGYVNIDKLLAMPLYSMTEDKAKEIEAKWKAKTAELNAMKNETPESIWTKDLADLEKALKNAELL